MHKIYMKYKQCLADISAQNLVDIFPVLYFCGIKCMLLIDIDAELKLENKKKEEKQISFPKPNHIVRPITQDLSV